MRTYIEKWNNRIALLVTHWSLTITSLGWRDESKKKTYVWPIAIEVWSFLYEKWLDREYYLVKANYQLEIEDYEAKNWYSFSPTISIEQLSIKKIISFIVCYSWEKTTHSTSKRQFICLIFQLIYGRRTHQVFDVEKTIG